MSYSANGLNYQEPNTKKNLLNVEISKQKDRIFNYFPKVPASIGTSQESKLNK